MASSKMLMSEWKHIVLRIVNGLCNICHKIFCTIENIESNSHDSKFVIFADVIVITAVY